MPVNAKVDRQLSSFDFALSYDRNGSAAVNREGGLTLPHELPTRPVLAAKATSSSPISVVAWIGATLQCTVPRANPPSLRRLHDHRGHIRRLLERLGRQMGIAHGHLGVGVPQDLLHLIQAAATVDQKAGEAVA